MQECLITSLVDSQLPLEGRCSLQAPHDDPVRTCGVARLKNHLPQLFHLTISCKLMGF